MLDRSDSIQKSNIVESFGDKSNSQELAFDNSRRSANLIIDMNQNYINRSSSDSNLGKSKGTSQN